jgi:nitric oxide reductase large subunit
VIMIVVIFGMMAAFEWTYLKKRARKKKRTYLLVFGIMVFALFYDLGIYFHSPFVPNPNRLVELVFKPLQDLILF